MSRNATNKSPFFTQKPDHSIRWELRLPHLPFHCDSLSSPVRRANIHHSQALKRLLSKKQNCTEETMTESPEGSENFSSGIPCHPVARANDMHDKNQRGGFPIFYVNLFEDLPAYFVFFGSVAPSTELFPSASSSFFFSETSPSSLSAYISKSFSSPRLAASTKTDRRQAGTKYNRAGCWGFRRKPKRGDYPGGTSENN